MTKSQDEKRLEYAIQVRNLEVGLFWQRSIFFWGFSGAALVAYSAFAEPADHFLRFLIACFGLLCSLAWTLVNRGSKYWHKAWDSKVVSAQEAVLGDSLFSEFEPANEKGWIWRARQYSVTNLTIALSDATTLAWLLLAAAASPGLSWSDWDLATLAALCGTLIYAAAMLVGGRSRV